MRALERTSVRRRLRLSLAAILAVGLAQATTLSRHPYLQDVRADRASVLWTTLEPGAGEVQFSTDRKAWRSAAARRRAHDPGETGLRTSYYQYQADLGGLATGTEYAYRVLVDGQLLADGEELRFRTAGPGPFQFLVVGDSGIGSVEQAAVAGLMLKERPALVLHAGDVSQLAGRFEDYDSYYFGFYRDLMRRAPFYPVAGNHDYLTNNAAGLLAGHALPTEGVPESGRGRYYSFDWGNVHFVAIDTNLPFSEAVRGAGPMLDWLEQDLARTRQFWRVAYFHHSPYASGFHQNDAIRPDLRSRLIPVLERYNVQVVFHGHEHSYQRTVPLRGGEPAEAEGTVYFTVGGGGAQLRQFSPYRLLAFGESAHHYMRVEVNGARMTLRAIRADGQEIDRVTLAPLPVLNAMPVVNAASFAPRLAPGALVSIFGRNLASEDQAAASLPLPVELGGVGITLEGRRLPLLYASSGQINAQLPFDAAGAGLLQVTAPNGSVFAGIVVTGAAPAVFGLPTGRGSQATIAHAGGGLVTPEAPAVPGESLTVYLTGLGRVEGTIEPGKPAPAGALRARAPVTVLVGGLAAAPSFAGLTPGFVGLYQVNFQVPARLPGGHIELVIAAGGASSEPVCLPVAGQPEAANSQGYLGAKLTSLK